MVIDTIEKLESLYGTPKPAAMIKVAKVYFQCSRAVMRSGLWDGRAAPDLPGVGDMLKALSNGAEGGAEYDRAWPERAGKNLW